MTKRWDAAHPEKMKEYRAKWLAANIDKVTAAKKKRYLDNRKAELENAARRYAANPESKSADSYFNERKST